MMTRSFLCILFSLLIYPLQTLAAADKILHSFDYSEGGGDQDVLLEQEQLEEDLRFEAIEWSHDWLKDYIDEVSYGIDGFFVDTFFGDDVINDDISGSRAKFSFYTRRVIGQPVYYKYGVNVRVVLPNTEDRFSLLVESSEDEEAADNQPIDPTEPVQYSTALRYMVKETDNWKVSFDNGIKWGIPPDPFTRLRFRRFGYFDIYHTRATQTFDWSVSDGFGSNTRFEINRPLDIDRLIRFETGAKYELNNDYFELDYGFSLYHELNKREVLAYYLRVSGENRSNMSFNNYGIGFRYRRVVYQDWVFVEFTPELETANVNNYDITPIIMFRFEALVGD